MEPFTWAVMGLFIWLVLPNRQKSQDNELRI